MILLKNVLVATDFSDASNVALDYGRDLARAYGATLHVLHVVEDLTYRFGSELGFPYPDAYGELADKAQKKVDALITEDDRATMRVVAAAQSALSAAAGIIDYAKANAIDVIVAGTHGRGALQHLLMGSVAERIVRTAPCPVLTVRSHEREFIVPDALVAAEVAAN